MNSLTGFTAGVLSTESAEVGSHNVVVAVAAVRGNGVDYCWPLRSLQHSINRLMPVSFVSSICRLLGSSISAFFSSSSFAGSEVDGKSAVFAGAEVEGKKVIGAGGGFK